MWYLKKKDIKVELELILILGIGADFYALSRDPRDAGRHDSQPGLEAARSTPMSRLPRSVKVL